MDTFGIQFGEQMNQIEKLKNWKKPKNQKNRKR